MPRFYFDVRVDGEFVEDIEGHELPGIDAAQKEAEEAVKAVGCDEFPDAPRGTREVAVQVREGDQHLQTVTANITFGLCRRH